MLTEEDCENFKRYGFVVVENVLTPAEVDAARQHLHDNVHAETGIYHQGENWSDVGARLKGPGMKMYYSRWKLDIQLHRNAINSYKQLLQETWGPSNISGFEHPFGSIDCEQTKQMVDRVCYRLPDCVHSEGGLSLHLDRNPLDPYLSLAGGLDKWRPIQGFICLTDHLDSGSGGLKVVPGFHKSIDRYFSEHASAEVRSECLGKRGEFFRMGGKSYTKLQKQLEVGPSAIYTGRSTSLCVVWGQTVYAPRGSMVLWDYRLPHATSEVLAGNDSREVVYVGFLPSIEINEVCNDDNAHERLAYAHSQFQYCALSTSSEICGASKRGHREESVPRARSSEPPISRPRLGNR
jgi:ectoine hydroxylase-related dioxygenase (phytanoyl-CoA dioxygenase family)